MKRLVLFTLALCVGVALGCGRDEAKEAGARVGEATEKAADAAGDAATAAREKAEAAAEEARNAATDAARMAREAAQDAAEMGRGAAEDSAAMARKAAEAAERAIPDVGAGPVPGADDPVAQCHALAAKMAWAQALTACTRAHELKPDDMAIEHALQQARAAAGR